MGQSEFSPQFCLLLQLLDHHRSSADRPDLQRLIEGLDGNWASFEWLMHRHRVTRRVVRALAAIGCAIPPSLAQVTERQALRALDQVVEASRIQQILAAHGITSMVLKGAVLSQTLYGDPALRESKDIDLLINPANFEAALGAIESAPGYEVRGSPPLQSDRLRLWLELNKDIKVISPGGLQIELHQRLTTVKELLPSLGLADAVDTVTIGANTFAQFDRPNLFVYLCVHGSVSRWHRLTWLADIQAMLATVEDAEIVGWFENASHHAAARCALAAMVLCKHLWDTSVPQTIIAAARTDPKVTKIVANCLTMMLDENYVPKGPVGPGYVSNALLLRDGPAYRCAILKELMFDPTQVGDIAIPYHLRFLFIPLRGWLWAKRRVARVLS